MSVERILFVNQEITPYLEASYMSIIGRYLPQSIQEQGIEIRTFMPRYGMINERRNQLHEVIRLSGQNIVINDNDHALVVQFYLIKSGFEHLHCFFFILRLESGDLTFYHDIRRDVMQSDCRFHFVDILSYPPLYLSLHPE